MEVSYSGAAGPSYKSDDSGFTTAGRGTTNGTNGDASLLDKKRAQWAKEQADREEWFPFGRPGAGAPLRQHRTPDNLSSRASCAPTARQRWQSASELNPQSCGMRPPMYQQQVSSPQQQQSPAHLYHNGVHYVQVLAPLGNGATQAPPRLVPLAAPAQPQTPPCQHANVPTRIPCPAAVNGAPQSYTEHWASQLPYWHPSEAPSGSYDAGSDAGGMLSRRCYPPQLTPISKATVGPIGNGAPPGVMSQSCMEPVVPPLAHSASCHDPGMMSAGGGLGLDALSSVSSSHGNGMSPLDPLNPGGRRVRRSRTMTDGGDAEERQAKAEYTRQAIAGQLAEKRAREQWEQERDAAETRRAEAERRRIEQRIQQQSEQEKNRWKQLADEEQRREAAMASALERAKMEADALRHQRLHSHVARARTESPPNVDVVAMTTPYRRVPDYNQQVPNWTAPAVVNGHEATLNGGGAAQSPSPGRRARGLIRPDADKPLKWRAAGGTEVNGEPLESSYRSSASDRAIVTATASASSSEMDTCEASGRSPRKKPSERQATTSAPRDERPIRPASRDPLELWEQVKLQQRQRAGGTQSERRQPVSRQSMRAKSTSIPTGARRARRANSNERPRDAEQRHDCDDNSVRPTTRRTPSKPPKPPADGTPLNGTEGAPVRPPRRLLSKRPTLEAMLAAPEDLDSTDTEPAAARSRRSFKSPSGRTASHKRQQNGADTTTAANSDSSARQNESNSERPATKVNRENGVIGDRPEESNGPNPLYQPVVTRKKRTKKQETPSEEPSPITNGTSEAKSPARSKAAAIPTPSKDAAAIPNGAVPHRRISPARRPPPSPPLKIDDKSGLENQGDGSLKNSNSSVQQNTSSNESVGKGKDCGGGDTPSKHFKSSWKYTPPQTAKSDAQPIRAAADSSENMDSSKQQSPPSASKSLARPLAPQRAVPPRPSITDVRDQDDCSLAPGVTSNRSLDAAGISSTRDDASVKSQSSRAEFGFTRGPLHSSINAKHSAGRQQRLLEQLQALRLQLKQRQTHVNSSASRLSLASTASK